MDVRDLLLRKGDHSLFRTCKAALNELRNNIEGKTVLHIFISFEEVREHVAETRILGLDASEEEFSNLLLLQKTAVSLYHFLHTTTTCVNLAEPNLAFSDEAVSWGR